MLLSPVDPKTLVPGDVVFCHYPTGKRAGLVCKRGGELWVKWTKGEGILTLDLLVRDMKLNGITIYGV